MWGVGGIRSFDHGFQGAKGCGKEDGGNLKGSCIATTRYHKLHCYLVYMHVYPARIVHEPFKAEK